MSITLRDYLSVSNISLRTGSDIRVIISCNPNEHLACDGATPGDNYDDSYSVIKRTYLLSSEIDDRFKRIYTDMDSTKFTALDCVVSSVFIDSTGISLYLKSPCYVAGRDC